MLMQGIVQTQTRASYTGLNKQFIAGHWRDGRAGAAMANINPFSGSDIFSIALANRADLDEAFAAAASAQQQWDAVLPAEKAAVFRRAASIMEDRREEIVSWLIRESGSTRIKAELEWQFTFAMTIEASSFPYRVTGRILPVDVPGKESRVYRRPIGVVGVISPWNWPMYLTHRSVAAALAVGNGVVVKPADDTPVTGGLLMAAVLEEAGLPPGLLNVVVGSVEEVGDAFTLHSVPRFISFTGSTRVGKHIGALAASGDHLKRVALELGGNAPFVVLDDADVDQAVRAAVFGRFLHQGEICMSVNRIIVDTKIYGEFADKFVERVRGLKCGDPDDPKTAIGPIINKRQLDGMMRRIEQARSSGIKQALGGEPRGLVLPPQVFVEVGNDTELAQTEQFGPIVPLIRVDGEAEALRIANDTQYGLSSAVFTRDEGRGLRFALQLQAGMTHINDMSANDAPNNPFGGEKNSGIGRFGGEWIIDEFTTDHLITVQHEPRAYPF
jgi:aldehyde dehydrogenase (NAD+)